MDRFVNCNEISVINQRFYKKLPHVDRELVEQLIDRIVVGDDKRVMIELRCADPLAKLRAVYGRQSEEKSNAG